MKKNCNKFVATFLLLTLFGFSANIFAQLVGGSTYPINGTENPPVSFSSITTAAAYLTTNGVTGSGEIILELSTGYAGEPGPVSIGAITGTSSTLGITFRPAVGYIAVTSIAGAATPNQHAIRLAGCNYITLDGRAGGVGTNRDWTISCTGATNGQMAVRLDHSVGAMTGVNLRYLILQGEATSTTGAILQLTQTTSTNTITNCIAENNLIQSGATLRGYGITLANASNVGNTGIIVRNNIIRQFYARGINLTGGFPGIEVYGNEIYHSAAVTQPTTTEFSAFYFSTTASTGAKLYNNYIHDIQLTNGTTSANGMYFFNGNTTGNRIQVYNNRIQIGNGIAVTTIPIYGIRDNTVTGALIDFYFNSILVDGSPAAGTSNSAAFIKLVSNNLNIKNNVFFNARSNSGATGTHWGISINNTTITSIGNNDYFANGTGGVLGTSNGTTGGNQLTLGAWQTAVPADLGSVSQNPNYNLDLSINAAIATQLESGGSSIAGITTDFQGEVRHATTPDIGADEFIGIPLDLSSPVISYAPLSFTSSTSARTLDATITDPGSGVPTAGIGLPVLYWRINSGSWNAAQATYLSGSNYQFSFGGGVVTGDTVRYFVVAQDLATTPNVGAFPSAGAGGFTPNPPFAATPPTTPSAYLITNAALAGDYTVGTALFNAFTGRNISFEKIVQKVMKEVDVIVEVPHLSDEKGQVTEKTFVQPATTKQLMEVDETTWIPMENGQPYLGDLYVKKVDHPEMNFPDGIDGIYSTITAAVADLNLRGVSGPVRFLLTDATYSTGETYPITFNVLNESVPTATNTVTLKPNTGVVSSITCASAINVFGIYDDYITFDGSNTVSGTTRDLTIVNTYLASTFNVGVVLWNNGVKGATNITVKNCIVEGDPTETSSYGLFLNFAGGGFDNTSFINNKIQNVKIGMQFVGFTPPGLITNNGLISGNTIGDVAKPVTIGGISGSYINNTTIVGNEIFGQAAGNTNTSQYGIQLGASSTNSKIQKNNIHDFYYTGTSGYGCFGIRYNSDATTVTEISNNIIYDIKGDGDASSLTYTPAGIYIISGGNVNIYYNSIYMSGNTLGQGTTYDGRSACLTIATGITLLDIRDNIFQNSMGQFPGSTRTNTTYGVYSSSANTAFTSINYNDYFVNGINPYVGYLGANQLDLTAWQVATGQDVNSISADPIYQSTTDLRPTYNSPVIAAGTPIAGITTDFLGVTRSATNPTIGAYEQGVIIPLPAGTYTVGLSAFMKTTGKKIYFETRTRTVTKDLLGDDSNIDLLAPKDEKNLSVNELNENQRYVSVTEEYLEMMEDGKPFDYSFFKSDQSMGVYPTITSAITDLILRGIAGPVTFLLVDTNYPTETYPLLIPDIVGASATNTITFKPGPGVQANIPGNPTQPTSTFQLGGADYIIVDGSNTVGGTTKDLHITSLISAPAFHFFGGSNHNIVMNTIFDSKYTSTASGTLIFGASASGDSNYVGNCTMTKNDTSAVRQGVGIYFFSSNTSTFNKIVGCTINEFNNYGIRVQGAPSTNNLIKGNTIEHINPSTVTTVYGIYISRQPGLVIEENYIKNLSSIVASPTLTAIYYLGSSGNPVVIYVRNNVISLSADVTQPAGTIRGIDYFAFAANSVEIYFNTIYIGGTSVTGGTTAGITKRDATTLYKSYDNAIYNTRSNGTGTGKHYAVYFSDTTVPFEMNNNDYFADGTGGVLGYFGTADQTTLAAWQSVTLQDANSVSANPIFVSNLDYRPQTTSPLLSAGLTISGITTDILGVLRGTPPTIGAYENGVFVPINVPSNLVALPDTFTVDLSWQDNSNNEFGFVIQRKDGDSLSVNPFANIDTVSANAINFIDTGLSPNTTYTYRVYGYNSSGNGGYSNMAEATTFIPVELSTFTAELSGREILVSWTTATELNNRGFDIERKMNGEWEKIGFTDGKGSTTEESFYSFVDKFTYESFVGTITYRLKQMDFNGTYAYSPEVEVAVDFTPKEYTLYQNYPNPFNPVTTIKYSLPFESSVRIAVYNILGEMLDVLVDETKQVGFHDFNWNASNLASGIYIYTIEAKSVTGDKNYSSVKKMILMK